MSISQTVDSPQERLPLKLLVFVFVVLGASYVLNAVDRQVFSMLLPSVMKEYNLPLHSGGLLVSIFTLGIGLAGIPTAYLMERLSRRTVMMIAIAIYSAFTLLTAYAVGFNDMFLYRTATGIGEGMQIAALYAAMGSYFPKHRALIFAFLSCLFGAGNFIGPLMVGHLLETQAWHYPLILFGIIGFAIVAMVAFVPKAFTEYKDVDATPAIAVNMSWSSVWNRNLALAVAAAITFGFSQFAFLSIYPSFLGKVLHFLPSSIGFTLSMIGLGLMAAAVTGFLGDQLSQKWIVFVALAAEAVIGYIVFNIITTPTHHAILSFLFGLFGATFIINTSSLMQRCVPAFHIAKVSGIYVTAVYLPASFSAYVFGLLVGEFGWGNAAVLQLTIVPLIGVVALFFMRPAGSRNEIAKQDVQAKSTGKISDGVVRA